MWRERGDSDKCKREAEEGRKKSLGGGMGVMCHNDENKFFHTHIIWGMYGRGRMRQIRQVDNIDPTAEMNVFNELPLTSRSSLSSYDYTAHFKWQNFKFCLSFIFECAVDAQYCPTMQKRKEKEVIPQLQKMLTNRGRRWDGSRKLAIKQNNKYKNIWKPLAFIKSQLDWHLRVHVLYHYCWHMNLTIAANSIL